MYVLKMKNPGPRNHVSTMDGFAQQELEKQEKQSMKLLKRKSSAPQDVEEAVQVDELRAIQFHLV